MSINGRDFVWAFIKLLLIAVVFALLYWLVGYLAALWGFPELLTKALYTILVIGGVIIAIDALLGLVGYSYIVWCLLIALTLNGCGKSQPAPTNDTLLDRPITLEELHERFRMEVRRADNNDRYIEEIRKLVMKLEQRLDSLEGNVQSVYDRQEQVNFQAYECVTRHNDLIANIEKRRCVKRPPWICCGQVRPGEPSIDVDGVDIQPLVLYPTRRKPIEAPDSPANDQSL